MAVLHLVSSYPIDLTTCCYYVYSGECYGLDVKYPHGLTFGHLVPDLWHLSEVEPCWRKGSLGFGLEAL